MVTADILNSHNLKTLRSEISKTNIKGYSKMKKAEVVSLMLKSKDKFMHIEMKDKKQKKQAEPKKERKEIKVTTFKEETKKKKIKLIKKKIKLIKKIDLSVVEDALDKMFVDNDYDDYIKDTGIFEEDIAENKILPEGGKRVDKAITALLKKTIKEQKIKTEKELIDYWSKRRKEFREKLKSMY